MKVQTSLCQQLVKSVWEAINVSDINLVNVYLETELLLRTYSYEILII